jgi:mannose-6-phosphate isomerase-like protein (cupin superfamily)
MIIKMTQRVALVAAAFTWVAVFAVTPARGAERVKMASADSLLAAYALPPGVGAKSFEIGRMSGVSVNFLQTRTGVKAHFHRQSDEVVYVISGKGKLTVGAEAILIGPDGSHKASRDALAGGRTMIVRAGSIILIPHGTAHQLEVLGQEPLVAYSTFSPAPGEDDRVYLTP